MRRSAVILMALLAGCATSAPVNWTSRYAADLPYINKSNIPATVFTAPDRSSAPTGSIAPSQGGFIQTCNDDLSWCKLSYGGLGASGWVSMTPFFANTR